VYSETQFATEATVSTDRKTVSDIDATFGVTVNNGTATVQHATMLLQVRMCDGYICLCT
jgi:hypothetical protein